MKYLLTACFILLLPLALHAEPWYEHVPRDQKPHVILPDADGAQRVIIDGGKHHIRPYYVIVKKDKPVELVIRDNSFLVHHSIVVKYGTNGDSEMIIARKKAGEAGTLKFTPDKLGLYTFYCDQDPAFLRSHRESGMEGTIAVYEPNKFQ